MNRVISKSTNLNGPKLSLKSLPFDLKIFNEPKTECYGFQASNKKSTLTTDQSSDDIPITEKCSFTQRLCTALMYSDAINQSTSFNDSDKRLLFVQFNEEIYQSVIDDMTHLIKEHDRHIDRIRDEWIDKYGFPKCSVSECVKTGRHYRGGRRERKEKAETESGDALYYFYESLFDRVHHYVFHLFDVGMRVDVSSLNLNEEGSDEEPNESEGVTVDKVFAAQREHIMSRRKELKIDSERMNPQNGKFAIQAVNEEQGITLRDAVIQEIAEKENEKKETPDQINSFSEENDFDSDAIEIDLEDVTDSNLYALIQDQSVVETMKTFIRSINLRRAAFSTGFKFEYYHEYHRDGVRKEMYVKPKYKNLKEEIIESGFLSLSKWMEFVDLKGRKYWNKSETVKKMKKHGEEEQRKYLPSVLDVDDSDSESDSDTYEFESDSDTDDTVKLSDPKQQIPSPTNHDGNRLIELSIEHLFVIILYCDFGKLCNAFSGTYRRQNVFESEESVVSRHSQFAHFGKLLFEMVNKFGICGYEGNGAQSREYGPFYCGINRVINIGSFAITLKGPNSTSTNNAVAVNFADEKGMILTLNNDKSKFTKFRKFFDCSWISNYFEEQERLWIASSSDSSLDNASLTLGDPLRIVSILLIQSAKNYWKAMRSLYLFDAMMSNVSQGGGSYQMEQDESDYHFISNLIDWTLNGGDIGSAPIDWFLQNEWNLFLHRKKDLKEIRLDLHRLNRYYPSLWKLVMFNVVVMYSDDDRAASGKDNVFKPEWISMFPSLETLHIITEHYGSYKFRFEALLESMRWISPSITVHVSGSWGIEKELTEDISAAFDAAGWNIEYKGDWGPLVIKSKSHSK